MFLSGPFWKRDIGKKLKGYPRVYEHLQHRPKASPFTPFLSTYKVQPGEDQDSCVGFPLLKISFVSFNYHGLPFAAEERQLLKENFEKIKIKNKK